MWRLRGAADAIENGELKIWGGEDWASDNSRSRIDYQTAKAGAVFRVSVLNGARSGIGFPGWGEGWFLGEEIEAVAKATFFGKEGVESLGIDAVGVVTVSARGDGFAFAHGPAHPAESGRGEHLGVEFRDFCAFEIVETAGDGFVGEDRFSESLAELLKAFDEIFQIGGGVGVGVSTEDVTEG